MFMIINYKSLLFLKMKALILICSSADQSSAECCFLRAMIHPAMASFGKRPLSHWTGLINGRFYDKSSKLIDVVLVVVCSHHEKILHKMLQLILKLTGLLLGQP